MNDVRKNVKCVPSLPLTFWAETISLEESFVAILYVKWIQCCCLILLRCFEFGASVAVDMQNPHVRSFRIYRLVR